MGELVNCIRCGAVGHLAGRCPEKRLQKLWPGQYVFRGKIRTPAGSVVELEMPLGSRGETILADLVKICATGDVEPKEG